MARFGAKSVVF